MEVFWDGEEERIKREPWDGWWRWRREAMSLWRRRPAERMTRPPWGSSRRSVIMCSWNWTILVVVSRCWRWKGDGGVGGFGRYMSGGVGGGKVAVDLEGLENFKVEILHSLVQKVLYFSTWALQHTRNSHFREKALKTFSLLEIDFFFFFLFVQLRTSKRISSCNVYN